jgi:release factor glutamine methyltransferase
MIKPSDFHAVDTQGKRINERRAAQPIEVELCGLKILVEPGVYQTSGDSELMAESVEIGPDQTFLEIGCGSGVVSLALARRAARGVGVDINERCVANSRRNAKANGAANVEFLASNMFEDVRGTFDVLIFNPPYSRHAARDEVDRMFWDPEDEAKRTFFEKAAEHLNPGGRVYFGWADFADIDVRLPFSLAEANGYRLAHTFTKPHKDKFTYYVLEFARG